MINDKQIQANIGDYLNAFNRQYNQFQQKKLNLYSILNQAAIKIQRMYRRYRDKKYFKNVLLIQRWWHKVNKKLQYKRKIITRLNDAYKKGVVYFFLIKKLTKKQLNTNPITPKQFKSLRRVMENLPKLITIKIVMKSEISYMDKYIEYLRITFNSNWQKYQEELKSNMMKEIKKKWVKKANNIWINTQDKEINPKQYIEKHIEIIFNQQFKKYNQNALQITQARDKLKRTIQIHETIYKKLFLAIKN